MINIKLQIKGYRSAKQRPFNRFASGVGAEVGSHVGWLARSFLQHKEVKFLYVVDSFLPEHAMGSHPGLRQYGCKMFAGLLLAQFKASRYRRLFKTSVEAPGNIDNATLDFVYIDAGHDYQSVSDDIVAWWPKVKAGGIIGGHDYFEGCSGVIKAVDEFANRNGLVVHSESNQPFEENDWWILKSK